MNNIDEDNNTAVETETAAVQSEKVDKNKGRLWNLNFFLLWQGQLVSNTGSVLAYIALGFWVLAVTGSTGLMATIIAVYTIPMVIISPFAGTLVDRTDRKWMLVLMDVIRGTVTVFIGIALFFDFIKIGMIFGLGIISGICGAFFRPAVQSSIPDIVPKSKVIKANSAFSISSSGTRIVGNSVGGFMYQILGAPLMFSINGLSYIFSAFTELFIKIPKIKREHKKEHFFQDMKSGISFIWNFSGLKYLFLTFAFLNFFASMSMILILPLFQKIEYLGAGLYGIVMGGFAGGGLAGYILLSTINFRSSRRFFVFSLAAIMASVCMIIFPLILYFPLMLCLAIVSGAMVSVINTFIASCLQIVVPQEKRGKVFGFLSTLGGGLAPLAMILGGILAEFIPIPFLISIGYGLCLFLFIILNFITSVRQLINFDTSRQTVENIR